MSLNTAHVNGGVLIHAGERILLFCDHVLMQFHGQDQPEFAGIKHGRLYLTTHRMIFNANNEEEKMQSFSFPFITISQVELEQPIFGANYIKGKCHAQPNGNWIGECKFNLSFKNGGATEFGQAMLKAARIIQCIGPVDDPPPYQPPTSNWYAAPPPAYTAAANGYYGLVPPINVFPDVPPANSVYMTDMPPPYPGINAPYLGYAGAPPQAALGGVQVGWTLLEQNGSPAWVNANFNARPWFQAGAYPNYGQLAYNMCYTRNLSKNTECKNGAVLRYYPQMNPPPPYTPNNYSKYL